MVFTGDEGNLNLQESRIRFIVEDLASKKVGEIESQVSKLSTAVTGLKFATDGIQWGSKGFNAVLGASRNKILELAPALDDVANESSLLSKAARNLDFSLEGLQIRNNNFIDSFGKLAQRVAFFEGIFTKLNITLLGLKGFLEIKEGLKEINFELTGVSRSLKLLDQNTGALEQISQLKGFKSPVGLLSLFGKQGQDNLTKAVTAYSKFNDALSRLNTIFLNTEKAVKANGVTIEEYGERIQDLVSNKLKNAISSTEALAGAYEVASGGFKNAADNSAVLEAGLKLATAAQADNASTLRLLVQTLKAYDLGAEKAADVAAKLFSITDNGITTISELNIGLAQTAGLAAQAGLKIDEVAGLVSELSKSTSTPIALSQIQALSRVIISGKLQENADNLNLTLNGARLALTAADIKANGFANTLKALKEATQGNSKTLREVTIDSLAFRGLITVISKDLDDFSSLISDKIGNVAAAQLEKAFGIRIDTSQTQKFIQILNKATEAIIRIGRIAAPFFESGLESLNNILQKTETFIVENEGLITTAIKASLAYNAFIGIIGIVAKTLFSLVGIFITLRVLNGQFFKDLGNLFRVTKNLDENANFLQIINNRIKNNSIVRAKDLNIQQKLLIVLRNITGIRAVERIELDNQNKVTRVYNKALGAQISGVNSLSTSLANLGDRVLPGLADRYKKSIAQITKTDLKPPEIDGGGLELSTKGVDAEKELSVFRKAGVLASSTSQAIGDNLRSGLDRAKASLISSLKPNERLIDIYSQQIETIEANTRKRIESNIQRGKTKSLTENEIALQSKANKATRIRTVFTANLALSYENLTGKVNKFLDKITDSKFSKALEEQRRVIEAQNIASNAINLGGAGTGVLATQALKLTAAQKAQAATAAIVSAAQENIGRKTSVLSSIYARQVQQIKTLQAEKNYLAGINKVVGLSFDQLASSVRANAIANTQLTAAQKAQAAASTVGVVAARATADARQSLSFAYKRELIQLRRLQAAKKLGIPIEEAATNATVRQTARTQIQVGVLGQLRSRIASLNVLFPTFAKGVTLVGGALAGILGIARSLITTVAPMLALAAAFKAFTFLTDLMNDSKKLETELVQVSEATREVLGITSDLGKIDTYRKLGAEAKDWGDAIGNVWGTLQDIGYFLSEPLRVTFQTRDLNKVSKIIDLVGESQLRSRKATLDLNEAFSATGKAGSLLENTFLTSADAIEKYNKASSEAIEAATNTLDRNKQALAITKKVLDGLRQEREERLAKEGEKVREQESFKNLESSIKSLEFEYNKAAKEADNFAASIALINEANRQRNIIQQRLISSNLDENQSTLANKLAASTKNANVELDKQLEKLNFIRQDFNKLDPKKDFEKIKAATLGIEQLTDKIEKTTLTQVSAIQKRFENNFITAKQAREELEAILSKQFVIDDQTSGQLEELLKPEVLQKLLDSRRDLLKEEVDRNKALYQSETVFYSQQQQAKILTAAEASLKINKLNVKAAKEDLRLIEEELKKRSITDRQKVKLERDRVAKQQEILNLEFNTRVSFLNKALLEEKEFFDKRLNLLQAYSSNELTNALDNQEELEQLQLKAARNTIEQLENRFNELNLNPKVDKKELEKTQQELLAATAKFEVLQVKLTQERGKRQLKQLENRGKKELLQLKLLSDRSLESRQKIADKEVELGREISLEEERLLKERLRTAREFGADTSEIEVQLLENQLERIEQTSSAISKQFEREANRLKSIADRFAAETKIEVTQQDRLKSVLDLQLKGLEQRNALSSLFQSFQVKSLESASSLVKSRIAQIGIERELLKVQEAAAVRQAALDRKRFEFKQREKDFEIEILEIKNKAAVAQSKADLANAIAKQKQLEFSKTATAEEREAARFQVEAAKENLKSQLLQNEQLGTRKKIRENERVIERTQLEQEIQARQDELEERRVALTKSTADDTRLAKERVARARNTKIPEVTQSQTKRQKEPISINIGGKQFTSRESVKLEKPKSTLDEFGVPQLKRKEPKKQKEPLSINIGGKQFTSRESVKLGSMEKEKDFKKVDLPQSVLSQVEQIENNFKGLQSQVEEAQKRADTKQALKQAPSNKLDIAFDKSTASLSNFKDLLDRASGSFLDLIKNIGQFTSSKNKNIEERMKKETEKTTKMEMSKTVNFSPSVEINISQSVGETPLDPDAIGDVVLDRLNSVADKLLRQS